MLKKQPPGTATAFLSSASAGDYLWWRQIAGIGTPLVEIWNEKQVCITFFWRDPAGDEHRSAIQQVYIDINGVTDHHSVTPQSMQRLSGTDVWHWSLTIEAQWRGSYNLIPVTREQLPPEFYGDEEQRSRQQREWWCSLFAYAIADPLNPLKPYSAHWGNVLSPAHMPAAPAQQAWRQWDSGAAPQPDPRRLRLFPWQSERLGNQRRIWLYTTGFSETETSRPLVIVLDGQKWAQQLPLFSALDAETAAGRLPAAVWLFVDVIDMQYRERELTCNADFWLAVQEELLPLAARYAAFSDDPDRTVVSGQSYGGLSALYAGLFWPQRFGRVLTQSGSFWWPNIKSLTPAARRPEHDVGWLIKQVRQGAGSQSPLTVFQEAGKREDDINMVNQQMYQALIAAGHQVNYRVYDGGHDSLCWRGGLIDGCRWLLSGGITPTDHELTGERDESGTVEPF
ncbi:MULTISPECIES: enterochelin esterase [Brenneria]|uniref:Enterochelin esterase n=1 Tax=Brenneria nigrifluens DSM 30175 = ATCC 13028 TaxID=1121120 RepID=A0A2U1UP75_9GAMM|nr:MULTISPECIES: enterochelin esterase [Brenneria]EHD23285.1 esterase [Brenneria sp. EniD312]PWC23473.1 enterochelin esterase [Brenneria nigrifluens] [Brenneria nigrifluens DSM 30175 = ATCC 13028]QCR06218.1 enterochelin esterase [Brenneria nigrifluens] [Brenneria nigrifluens DSM 30175 = ATCC 13028]